MSIVYELSSQAGDRTETSNKRVAAQCMEHPELLEAIAEGLASEDGALAGDCAEVMTMIAEQQPSLVVPYAPLLPPLLGHRKIRVRWEAMHALSLTAAYTPQVIEPLLPELDRIIHGEKSVIVRDYAVDTAGNYAQVSGKAAREAYPILTAALDTWDGKQAGHALAGLAHVAEQAPELRSEIRVAAERFSEHPKNIVRKAAKRLLKTPAT